MPTFQKNYPLLTGPLFFDVIANFVNLNGVVTTVTAEVGPYLFNDNFRITGTIFNDTLNGAGGYDELYGNAGDDTINTARNGGEFGIDYVYGGDGNDTINVVGDGVFRIYGDGINGYLGALSAAPGDDIINLTGAGTNNLQWIEVFGGGGNDTITGSDGQDFIYGDTTSLIGDTGNDTLNSQGGADVIYSYGGVDVIDGGTSGADVDWLQFYRTSAVADIIYVALASGIVTVTGDGSTIANIERFDIRTGSGDDTITTLDGNDEIWGGDGNDTLSGAGGIDIIYGEAGSDTLNGGDGGDTLYGASTSLTSDTENDTLNGEGGADVIYSYGGADTIDGGSSRSDWLGFYRTSAVADIIYVALASGIVTVIGDGSTIAKIESFDFRSGSGNDIITTLNFNDEIRGGDGNDIISGAGGIDTLYGEAGDDTLYGDGGGYGGFVGSYLFGGTGNDTINIGGGITAPYSARGGDGNDTINVTSTGYAQIYGDDLNGLDVEITAPGDDIIDLTGAGTNTGFFISVFAGAGNDTVTGSGGLDMLYGDYGDDTLNGGAGDDLLVGNEGADIMIGGDGNDEYFVEDVTDAVSETNATQAVGGIDLVRTTLNSFTLGANFENLTYTGTGEFTGTGNGLANIITGGDGSNTLSGLGGDDILIGGALSDDLSGGLGNDRLIGGLGADTMKGGAGNDLYYVDDAGDVTDETGGSGIDLVRTALSSYTLAAAGVENLEYIGAGSFTGTGNTLGNQITGGAQADTLYGLDGNDALFGGGGGDFLFGGLGGDRLNGGAGADTMKGGSGNDVYVIDTALDVIDESALAGGNGIDSVEITGASITTYTLAATLENLIYLSTGSITATGNSLANVIIGGTKGDILNGGGGADSLTGGGGNDTLNGGAGNDRFVFSGGFGDDTVQSFGDGTSNQDVLAFSKAHFANFAAVLAHMVQAGSDVIITSGANTVTIENVILANLGSDDFRFI